MENRIKKIPEEKIKDTAIKTNNKSYCSICGTYTIDYKGCNNINHNRNLDLFLSKDDFNIDNLEISIELSVKE